MGVNVAQISRIVNNICWDDINYTQEDLEWLTLLII